MSAISTAPWPTGTRPRRSKVKRICGSCGKVVCSYKNPYSRTPKCYACEDKLPWTYALIAGGGTFAENPENRRGHSANLVVSSDDPTS